MRSLFLIPAFCSALLLAGCLPPPHHDGHRGERYEEPRHHKDARYHPSSAGQHHEERGKVAPHAGRHQKQSDSFRPGGAHQKPGKVEGKRPSDERGQKQEKWGGSRSDHGRR